MAASINFAQQIRDKLLSNPISKEQYQHFRYEFIKENEHSRGKVYQDSRGYKNVGLGFNMHNKGAREEWNKAFAKYNSEVSFDEVLNGKRILSTAEIKILFDYSTAIRERELTNIYGNSTWLKLPLNIRLAIEDLYYNGGSKLVGIKTNFYKNIQHYADGGEQSFLEAAIYEVKCRSNPVGRPDWAGIQNRRDAEAELLKTPAEINSNLWFQDIEQQLCWVDKEITDWII